MTDTARTLGQLLVDSHLLNKDDLEAELVSAPSDGADLAHRLVSMGRVRARDLLQAVSGQLGVDFVDIAATTPEPAALARISAEDARKLVAVPVGIHQGGRLVVAAATATDQRTIEALRAATGGEVEVRLALRHDLHEAIERHYAAKTPAAPEPAGRPQRPGVEDSVVPAPTRAPVVAGDGDRVGMESGGLHINELLHELVELDGSDLHLTAGSPPQVRVHGSLRSLEGYEPTMPADLRTMIYAVLTSAQRESFEESLELDASHPVPGLGRFRVNVFFQRGSVGAVLRAIPNSIKSLEELGVPESVGSFAELTQGLVLVTGATGSGKSTTLASLIDTINRDRSVHIMTVEDPIEFMHRHRRSIVNQREIGSDTTSFSIALRHALRQDPDVILVGEMRDLETIGTALTAAETGHLVFATLHTRDAPSSVDRVIDVFPPHQQQQVRVQLASTLQGVVTQALLPTVDGRGRAPAVEVMVAVPAIRNLIREGKVHQIRTAMQSGARHGMQTMDQSLAELVRAGKVDMREALDVAPNPEEFSNLLGGWRR